jgi:hypothetical protein
MSKYPKQRFNQYHTQLLFYSHTADRDSHYQLDKVSGFFPLLRAILKVK